MFCKAYRQVDPPVHTSMRHLFGTWKGVFSPASLQMIEKELGFQSSANGSSGAAPSKADSPSQRPSHSIHVNPKYLEARQQLQQPNKGILGAGAKTPIISDADDVIERGNRIGIDKGTGRRLDTLNSRPRAQKDTFSNPIHEKPDRDVRGPGIAGAGQVRSKPKGQDGIVGAYYTGGVSSPEEIFDRRNHLYATKDVRSSGSVRLDSALLPTPVSNSDRIGRLSSSDKSWKNSEEEEYIWDDIRSQGADYGGASSARKGEPLADDGNIRSFHRANWAEPGDPLDPDFHKQDTIPRFGHPTSQDRRLAPYMDHAEYLHSKREGEPRIDREMWPEGQPFPESRGSSLWLSQEKPRTDIGRDPRISRFSNQSPSITSSVPVGLSGAYAGRSSLESAKQKYWPPSSPPLQARESSPSSSEHDVYASRSFLPLGQNPQEEHNQRAHALSQNSVNSQGRPSLQATLSQASQQTQKHPSVHSKPHPKPFHQPFSQENSSSLFRPSVHLPLSTGMEQQPEEVSLPSDPTHAKSDQISASNLLAGLFKGGFIPNTSDHAVPHPHVLASLPSSSASENAQLKPHAPNSLRPPLPPGPPPTQSAEKAAPLSSLLNSLVAKGLISSPSTDSSAVARKPSKSSPSTSDVSASAPPLPIVQPSVAKETPAPIKALLPQPPEVEMADLIGLEFKPVVLREHRTEVVNRLFDDQSHQCRTCGLRFRLEDELSAHTACNGPEEARNTGIAPERWYPSKSRWIDRLPEPQSIFLDSASDSDLGTAEEVCEFMVPADESQIICCLCGEQFDDMYSIDRSEWMYKDAVYYYRSKAEGGSGGSSQSKELAPIVHARCMPRISNDGMEVD